MAFTIRINGSMQRVDVDGDTPLLRLLRDALDAARVGECNS
jgi:aerobic-type carbon monoxide dehydrogenase small subunit (CoxS/CutS family)